MKKEKKLKSISQVLLAISCLTSFLQSQAMAVPPKEKKVRAQRAREKPGNRKTEPESVQIELFHTCTHHCSNCSTKLQITNTKALEMEGQTAKRVAFSKKKLEQTKQKNFFEIRTRSYSYSQTVENLFPRFLPCAQRNVRLTCPVRRCVIS